MAPPPRGPGPTVVRASRWSLITVAAVLILARVYLRLRMKRQRLLSSDIFMILAWCSAVALGCIDDKIARLGALEPQVMTTLAGYEGTPEQIETILRLFWAGSLPFFTGFYLCKASLLVVYLQIFPTFMKKRRIILWVVIGYVIVAYIVSISMVLFSCLPIESNWSLNPATACSPSKNKRTFQVAWVLHFSGDLMIFALPWSIITKLQMRRSMKIGVFCTFLLGIINMIFCLLRFISVQSAIVNSSVALSIVALWSSLDINIGLVIACLPALRPFFHRAQSESSYQSGSGPYRGSHRGAHRGADLGAAESGHHVTHDPYGRELGPDVLSTFDGSLDDGKKSQSQVSIVALIEMPGEARK